MLIDTSHLSQGKSLFSHLDLQNGECEEMHSGSFGFPEYPKKKQKNNTEGRTGESRSRVVCFLLRRKGTRKAFSKWIKVTNCSTRSGIGYCGRRMSHR